MGIEVPGLEVVHQLGGRFETALIEVGEGKDRLEAVVVGADAVGGIGLAVLAGGQIDVDADGQMPVRRKMPADDQRVDDDVAETEDAAVTDARNRGVQSLVNQWHDRMHCPVTPQDLLLGDMDEAQGVESGADIESRHLLPVLGAIVALVIAEIVDEIVARWRQGADHEVFRAVRVLVGTLLGQDGRAGQQCRHGQEQKFFRGIIHGIPPCSCAPPLGMATGYGPGAARSPILAALASALRKACRNAVAAP
ncbi:MAG: hypothetical protein AW09_002952 [Candidatus Accumulibacter phosphatis]|uniref:Uncharacterized protein n=1 Tax=Candidatus Accumulibacter phosphatis TaxID=327160 RepID=A0A080LVZ8_9PROT|nr:MAG: hypothetical protein AW09_002952 [Candidatus Accumulibacter phosphatis]